MRRGRRRRYVVSAALAAVVITLVAGTIWSRRQPGRWQHVFATREGMVGHVTASGMIIRADSRFVALPDPRALGRDVEVRHGTISVVVPVLDVGPWNIHDPYWERDDRPAAERGHGTYRTPSNVAGIDLSDAVFETLGLHDNDYVDWRYVHRDYVAWPTL
jgi:hypothetical protein